MNNFEYARVSTIEAALEQFSKHPNSTYIAGGTNLVDLLKKGVLHSNRLIDINPIPLKQLNISDSGAEIGALVSNSDLAADPLIKQNYPLLSQALHAGASAQVRNMATVGGNILQKTRCSYFYDTSMPCNKRQPGTGCAAIGGYNRMHAIFGSSSQCIAVHPSDMCVALTALEAEVHVQGPAGKRKIPFAQFHRLPEANAQLDNTLKRGELITHIQLKKPVFTKHVHYLKLRDRNSYAFALVSVAAALEIKDNTIQQCRLVLGSVAHKPWRLTAVEKFLTGKSISEKILKEAALQSITGAKAFAQNQFKLTLTPAAVEEALTKAVKGIA